MRKGTSHTNASKAKNAEAQRNNALIAREKRSRSNDSGVSPVIGVILMVAITVILAAVMAAFVFGFSGNIDKPHYAVISADKISDLSLRTVLHSGSDLAGYIININDGETSFIGNVAAPLGDLPLDVGSSATTTSTTPIKRVVITGVFMDSTKQILLDKVF